MVRRWLKYYASDALPPKLFGEFLDRGTRPCCLGNTLHYSYIIPNKTNGFIPPTREMLLGGTPRPLDKGALSPCLSPIIIQRTSEAGH